ncbi:putative membrane protein [Crossiella equi]|uniref:Membrane protein n=1 Tax=Crossiella equi TaxID=130796 RepID=A0ABS5A8P1_9PSEU|nr:hypothetical protein [Crossiella equi]MBP2472671.1 putative membrane protein [Crossiella equi]
MFRASLALVPLLLLGVATPALAADAVTELPSRPGAVLTEVSDINDHGVAVGQSGANNERRAVRWTPEGALAELAQPGKTVQSWAHGINNSGVAVGYATDPFGQGTTHAVRWDAQGRPEQLPLPGGTDPFAEAFDINEQGVVAGRGWSHPGQPEAGVYRALRWSADGVLTVLPPLPGDRESHARGIAPDGTVVGYSEYRNRWTAVRWLPDGTVQPLPPLPGKTLSSAEAINRDGVIVGFSGSRPVRWAPDGTVTDLGTPAGTSGGFATDVNDAGLVTITAHHDGRAENTALVRELDGTFTALPRPHRDSAVVNALNNAGTAVGLTGIQSYDFRAVRWDR